MAMKQEMISKDEPLYHALSSIGVIADANEWNSAEDPWIPAPAPPLSYNEAIELNKENEKYLPPDILTGPKVKSKSRFERIREDMEEDDLPNYNDWSDEQILAEEERIGRHVSNAAMGLLNPGADALDTSMYISEYFKGEASLGDIGWSLANFLPFAAFGKIKKVKQLAQLRKLKKLRGLDTVDDVLKHSDELGGFGGSARPRVDLDAPVDASRYTDDVAGSRPLHTADDVGGGSRLQNEVDDIVADIEANNTRSTNNINRQNAIEAQTRELQTYVDANPNLEIKFDADGSNPRLHSPPTQDWVHEVPGITDRPGAYKDFPQFHGDYDPGYIRQGRDWVTDRIWNENASKWIRYPVRTAVGGGVGYGGYKGGQAMGFWGEQPARELSGLGIQDNDSIMKPNALINSIREEAINEGSLPDSTSVRLQTKKKFVYHPSDRYK
tara:strand:+ start:1044 stop:2363 length:1320 start_codon:yes stop_codon:yes gene_type:complete